MPKRKEDAVSVIEKVAVDAPITEEKPKKKGKAIWKPAERLGVLDKNANYRYKWVNKEPSNLERKFAEGYVPANSITGLTAEHKEGVRAIDGSEIAGAKSHRELVLCALPNELAEARDEYFQNQTDRQTRNLKQKLQNDLSAGGPARVDGKITIIE